MTEQDLNYPKNQLSSQNNAWCCAECGEVVLADTQAEADLLLPRACIFMNVRKTGRFYKGNCLAVHPSMVFSNTTTLAEIPEG